MDAVVSAVAAPAASAAVNAARQSVLSRCSPERYNEDEVKKALLTELQRIKDDTSALRQSDLHTASQAMRSWRESSEDVGSPVNVGRLKVASERARAAFNLVPEAVDKLRAAALVVYAEYHLVALTSPAAIESDVDGGGAVEDEGRDAVPSGRFSSRRNWCAGKVEAQRLLRQYASDMPQLSAAAREELDRPLLTRIRGGRGADRRRAVLREFASLSAAVHALRPRSLNGSHPRFDAEERAVLRACDRAPAIMRAATVNHMLSGPRERMILRGHTGWVLCCHPFGGGSRVASGGYDGALRVWDLGTGTAVLVLQGGSGWVHCCDIFLEDTRLVGGYEDGSLKIWDLDTGEEVGSLKGHGDRVNCCCVYGDGDSHLLSGSDDSTLRVWNLKEMKEELTLCGHTDEVLCCSTFADGTRAISGGADRTVRVWELLDGTELRIFRDHTDIVTCCSVSEDEMRAVSGSWDGTLRLWDLKEDSSGGEEESTSVLKGHDGVVLCCDLFDGGRAASGGADGTVRVWDLATGSEIHHLTGHGGSVYCCSAFEDGVRVVGGGDDTTLRVWDLPTSSGPNGQEEKEQS